MAFSQTAYPQPEYPEYIEEKAYAGEHEKKHPLIAGGETLFSNLFLIGITSLAGVSWARPDLGTISNNVTLPWIWEDREGFKINQIGHPYQGSLYFNAGRANGFTFYESLVFNAIGSSTWEVFGERERAALNDLVTTTFGAAPLGEMMHRLYIEADAAGVPLPLSFLISPMDGFNRLITGGRSGAGAERRLYELSVYTGFSHTNMKYTVRQEKKTTLFLFDDYTSSRGIRIVYGDPFIASGAEPFRQFECDISFSMNIDKYIDLRIVSDGYLFSFTPPFSIRGDMSAGLSLHSDIVSLGKFDMDDSTIDQYSQGLDMTIKYRYTFHKQLVTTLKVHGGSTFWSVSEYYTPDIEEGTLLKNYGGGYNVKLFFNMAHPVYGSFSCDILHYFIWSFPGIMLFEKGKVFWFFVHAAYEYPLSNRIALGIQDSFTVERGFFVGLPTAKKQANTFMMYIRWIW